MSQFRRIKHQSFNVDKGTVCGHSPKSEITSGLDYVLRVNSSVPVGLCQRRVSMDNIPLYFIPLNQAVQARKKIKLGVRSLEERGNRVID